jgi:hypothetical protein
LDYLNLLGRLGWYYYHLLRKARGTKALDIVPETTHPPICPPTAGQQRRTA